MRTVKSAGLVIKRPSKYLFLACLTSVAILTVATFFALSAPSANAITPPDSCFNFNAGTGTITGYYDNEDNNIANPECPRAVDIPGSIGGINVVAIGNSSFGGKQLTSVSIPGSVSTIGEAAFINNNLTSVTLSNGIMTIGQQAFKFNDIVTLTLPASLTSIDIGTFEHNELLTSVTIESTSLSIGGWAFHNTYSLSNVTINGSVTTFGNSAFRNANLTSLTIAEGATSIDESAFEGNDIASLSLPGSLTSIGRAVFHSNKLTSVTIPENVGSIGIAAFENNLLGTVSISGTNLTIGNGAFRNNQISTLTLNNGIVVIEEFAFNANQLTSLILPNTVTTVGERAFEYNNITSVTIPENLTTIGEAAFKSNDITHPIILGSPTGPAIFQNNPITAITYNGTLYSPSANIITTPTAPPDECFAINTATGIIDSFSNGVDDSTTLTSLSNGSVCNARYTNVIVPDVINGTTVTGVGGWHVFGLKGLTGISLPSFLTNEIDIGYNNISNFIIPAGFTGLTGYRYVYNSLTRLTIPQSVTYIDRDAFLGQNPWGGDTQWEANADKYIYSDNPIVVQHVYDNIWYLRAYTAAGNPNNLNDWAVSEWWDVGDGNQNGKESESIGGHIINPASTVVQYKDTSGNTIAPSVTVTGLKTGKTPSSSLDTSDYLHTYLVTESDVPAPLDPYNSPDPQEVADMKASFQQYYRMGQSVTFIPKTIPGYITPSTQNVTLNQEDNVVTFTYKPFVTSISFTDGIVTGGEITSATPPVGVHVPLIANSQLAIAGTSDGSPSDCSRIESASLLAPSVITKNIPAGTTLLGGLDFSLFCSNGGQTGIEFVFGTRVRDIAKLQIYKYDTDSRQLTKINDKVTISTRTIDGGQKTVLSYTLTDGGELDEDGVANGAIEDPLIIGYAGDVSELFGEEMLADTGLNMWMVIAVSTAAPLLGAGLLLKLRRHN